MESMGLNLVFLLAQLFNLSLLVAWVAASVAALFRLRRTALPPVARVLWALLICIVPLLGAGAFFIVQPDEAQS